MLQSIGDRREPKCFFSQSRLPVKHHEKELCSKLPLSIISAHKFNHTIDVILPQQVFNIAQNDLSTLLASFRFSRVYMKLSDILHRDFFTYYIKQGSILMLSEGQPGIDNIFFLSDGLLRLELDKPTYERCGLVGKPIQHYGRKHLKFRYSVEINLRLPSMLHGKKGFDRIVWACSHVLNQSLQWLFCDLRGQDQSIGPISQHHPNDVPGNFTISHSPDTLCPHFIPPSGVIDPTYATSVLEWLGLASLGSSRISSNDRPDPHISHYSVPTADEDQSDAPQPEARSVTRLRWQGFAPPLSVAKLFFAIRMAAGNDWSAMSVSSFGGEAYSLMSIGDEILAWHYSNHGNLSSQVPPGEGTN